ncbi:MAG: hypothetical protein Q8R31_01085 [Candidatus Omnitrophota bacterium]|nr:hypothetical protein [Candidatus Omnitrophota bacterium]
MTKQKGVEVKNIENKKRQNKEKWQKPTLEDVSGKIMAQPYIRFT